MWAASLEWPLAFRTARRVSTRVDLSSSSDESPSPRRRSKRLESADLDPRRTAGLDLPVPDPSTPEIMKLPVAVERSESPWRLVTERSSAELEEPSDGCMDGSLCLHLEVWNYHVAVESGKVDHRTNISRLLGNQKQSTVVPEGCHQRWWPALWPPSTARHPRLTGCLAGCFWSGSWCTDGSAEVFDGK